MIPLMWNIKNKTKQNKLIDTDNKWKLTIRERGMQGGQNE